MKTQSKLAKISVVGAAVGLASVFSLSAQTQMNTTSKWYVGGDAGLCLQQNVGGLKANGVGYPGAKFDPGVRADLSVGYNLAENWAVELESGFSYNELSHFGMYTAPGYKLYQVPVLLNGIYKYSFNDKWQAYGGVGLGGVARQRILWHHSWAQRQDEGRSGRGVGVCREGRRQNREAGARRVLGRPQRLFFRSRWLLLGSCMGTERHLRQAGPYPCVEPAESVNSAK